MDDKVILGPLALTDLDQILRYITSRDPAAAGRLGTRLLDQAETLCRLPHRGGQVRRRPGVRRRVWLVPKFHLGTSPQKTCFRHSIRGTSHKICARH